MRASSRVVWVALACAASAVHAGEAGSGDTFVGLIADAVLRQPDLGAQQAAVREARGVLSVARADRLPRLQMLMDTGDDHTVRDGRSQDAGGARAGRIKPQLALSQLLYDGGAARARVQASSDRVSSASRTVDASSNRLALQGVSAYLAVLREREAVSIARQNVERVQAVRDKVAGRAAEGRDPRSELERLDSRVLEARSQLADAQRTLDDADAAFEEFFGTRSPPNLPEVSVPQRRASVDDAMSYARDNSPELLALGDQVDAGESDLKAERAARNWPRLSLEATGTAYDAFGAGSFRDRDTYVGLRVSYDLFSGGASRGRTQEVRGRAEAARMEQERGQRALDRQLRQAYAAVEARSRQVGPLADRVALDLRAIDDYEELFLAGRRSLNDMIVAQRDYYTSAMLHLQTRFDLMEQEFSIPALTGELSAFFGLQPFAEDEGAGR